MCKRIILTSFLALTVAAAPACVDASAMGGSSGLVLSKAVVTIGDGITSGGDFIGADDAPFVLALDAIPEGGTIIVGAGVYQFDAPVVVDVPRVKIQGSGAALHAANGPGVGLFTVLEDDFELSNMTLCNEEPSTGSSLVSIDASDVRVEDCTFHGGAGAGSSVFLELNGPARDRWISNNRFHSEGAWTAVHAEGGRAIHIAGNHLSGSSQDLLELEYGFYLLDEAQGVISNNVFREVGGGNTTLKAIVYAENTEGEQHHLLIADNFIHGMLGERVLDLRGSHFNLITGNSFGRIAGAMAVVDISPSPSGSQPSATTISGNDFHNPGLCPAVRINGGSMHTVSSNHFTLSMNRSVVVGDLAPVERTQITGNQFVALTKAIRREPAVEITGGKQHAVQANTFYDYAAPAIRIQGVAPADYTIQANFEH